MLRRWQEGRAILLLVIFLVGLIPACGTGVGKNHPQDDALLLMIASQVKLMESVDGEPQARMLGHQRMKPVYVLWNGTGANEVVYLIELYRKNLDTVERQKDQYTNRQYQFLQNALNEKLSELEHQAESLTRRRRRRGFNPFKIIGRGIGRLAKGIGRGIKFVAVEGGRLAIHFVVGKVKATIRDVFEGRVNSIIARFASRFGPLSPWVEARLKRVLDRWWVGFRDRVTGRASRYATQTAESGGSILDDEAAGEDSPQTDSFGEDWLDPLWTEIEGMLVSDRKNCQSTSIAQLRQCFMDQFVSGSGADEAFDACASLYDAIPANDAGGTVTMTGEVNYGGAVANEFSLMYPSTGGGVSGSFYYQLYDDVFFCSISVTTSAVTGTYDPSTCTMSGTATMTLTYEADGAAGACVSVCGPTDASPAACPVTIQGSTTWEAELEDGVLSGSVGGSNCDPHCFGFQAPGYGLGQ